MAYDPDSPPQKPSTAPSWVFLGFVLGALCILALPSKKKPEAEPAPVAVAKPEPPPPPRPTRFDEVQAVFSAYAQYAVWQNDTTEICVYDPDLKRFGECYEVFRSGDQMYYRSISGLTRPILTHGVPQNSPIEFTEPAESRAQWLSEVHDQNWREFSNGVREGMEEASGSRAPAAATSVNSGPIAVPMTTTSANKPEEGPTK